MIYSYLLASPPHDYKTKKLNEKRVVVALAVDPTNETIVVPEMLDQAARTTGQDPKELLEGGGYCNEAVISTTGVFQFRKWTVLIKCQDFAGKHFQTLYP